MQLNVMSVRSVALVKSSTVGRPSVPMIKLNIMSVTLAELANSSKHLMLLSLSVPVMQVILSFVIPLVNLFLILLVIFSHLNLFVNFLMRAKSVIMNDLLVIRVVANMILQNHLVAWIL